MKKLVLLPVFLFILALITSCGSDAVIDKYKDIHAGVWSVDSLASFNFEIEDTTTQYKVSYNVRYAAEYPYYNLYVTYYLEDSTGSILASELQDLTLFDKINGDALGKGLGDLFDREIMIFDEYQFKNPGKYTFKVKQFMRMEDLPGIMSFGLTVEPKTNE